MFVGHLNSAVGPGGGTRPQAHGGHDVAVPGQYRLGHGCVVDNDVKLPSAGNGIDTTLLTGVTEGAGFDPPD